MDKKEKSEIEKLGERLQKQVWRENKAKLKKEIQQQLGLPVKSDVPLFAMISRLAAQKGFDTVLNCLECILTEQDVQFVIIGTGDSNLENRLKELGEKHENLSVNILFSNKIAHLLGEQGLY